MRTTGTPCTTKNLRSEGLSRSEELELLYAYRSGSIAQESIQQGGHSKQDLEQRVVRGKEAEEKLLVSHFPMVKSIALELFAKHRSCVDLDDLVAAGNVGLVVALRKFDLRRGCRFNTYARWWIRNCMSTMIRKERWVINIPDHIYKSLLPVMKFVGQFRYLTGRDPTVHDIAKRFDRPVAFFKKLLAWMEQKEISLSTPVGDDGTSVLADLIEDRSTITPSEVLVNVDLKDKISQILKTLTPREEKIIKMRFGLEDGEEIKPLEENCALPVSADIAREIEGRAIRKLRHPSRLNKLQPFVRQVDRD